MRPFGASGLGILAAALVLWPAMARSQMVGVPIEPKRTPQRRPELTAQLQALKSDGKLMSREAIVAALETPTPAAVHLPPVGEEPMRPAVIAARLRKSALRVGWYFLCNKCQNWHVNLAGGYLLSMDGAGATCYHVLHNTNQEMREGYVFAVDHDGVVHPITQVLAADERMDTVIFKMEMADTTGLAPLAINDQTSPGDPAYLLSDPSGVSGYFSEGIINRFYWDEDKPGADPMSLTDARSLRMDVSTDWAPGSSGSPLVDACGNVIGHVSKISAIMSDSPHQSAATATGPSEVSTTMCMKWDNIPNTQVVLHEAIPIRCARLLINTINNASNVDATLIAEDIQN